MCTKEISPYTHTHTHTQNNNHDNNDYNLQDIIPCTKDSRMSRI